jgi:cytochrome b561
MQWRNSQATYGAVSVVLHWVIALVVFGLFGLGVWMRTLDYYSPWYHDAPEIHKSLGVLLFIAMLARVIWRFASPGPVALASHGPLTRAATKVGHGLLYLGLFAVMIAGYLISTAEGAPVSVFGVFQVPAVMAPFADQGDIAGAVHKYLAWSLVIFAVLHGLAALKHHVIDRDTTLLRMFGRASGRGVAH